MDEKQLYETLLGGEAEDEEAFDLDAYPGQDEIEQAKALLARLNAQFGLPRLPPGEEAALGMAVRPEDAIVDNALGAILDKYAVLRERTGASSGLIELLLGLEIGTAALETSTESLEVLLLGAVEAIQDALLADNDLIDEALNTDQPEVAGVATALLRQIFRRTEILKDQQARKEKAKKDELSRTRRRTTGRVQQAEQQLSEEQSVDKLRRTAERGQRPPLRGPGGDE